MTKVVTTGLTISNVLYGEPVQAGELVGWRNGRLVRACAVATDPIPAVGVAAASYRANELGAMHLSGEVSGFDNLAVGASQYLSQYAPGDIQSVSPTDPGSLLQLVGYAVAPDRLVVAIRDWGTYVQGRTCVSAQRLGAGPTGPPLPECGGKVGQQVSREDSRAGLSGEAGELPACCPVPPTGFRHATLLTFCRLATLASGKLGGRGRLPKLGRGVAGGELGKVVGRLRRGD